MKMRKERKSFAFLVRVVFIGTLFLPTYLLAENPDAFFEGKKDPKYQEKNGIEKKIDRRLKKKGYQPIGAIFREIKSDLKKEKNRSIPIKISHITEKEDLLKPEEKNHREKLEPKEPDTTIPNQEAYESQKFIETDAIEEEKNEIKTEENREEKVIEQEEDPPLPSPASSSEFLQASSSRDEKSMEGSREEFPLSEKEMNMDTASSAETEETIPDTRGDKREVKDESQNLEEEKNPLDKERAKEKQLEEEIDKQEEVLKKDSPTVEEPNELEGGLNNQSQKKSQEGKEPEKEEEIKETPEEEMPPILSFDSEEETRETILQKESDEALEKPLFEENLKEEEKGKEEESSNEEENGDSSSEEMERPREDENPDEIIVPSPTSEPRIKAIYITGPDRDLADEETTTTQGVLFGNRFDLGCKDKQKITDALLPFIDEGEIDQKHIEKMKQVLYQTYECIGLPFIYIHLPEQDISSGVIHFEVIQSRVGNISSLHNCHFSSQALLSKLRIKEGDRIDTKTLSTDLEWMNQNPFRSSSIVYAAGEQPFTTDVKLLTDDRRPFRIYTGIDNTGFKDTDTSRFYAGFNWGNAWGIDHLFSYQYTSSLDFDRFYAHTAIYEIPLPTRDFLQFFGGYSVVKPDTRSVAPPFKDSDFGSKGTSWQVSGRYMYLFPASYGILQKLLVGVDYKSTDNSYAFGEEILSQNHASLSQATLGYHMTFRGRRIHGLFETDLFFSPGKIFKDESNQIYDQLRPYAKNRYFYVKGTLQTLLDIGGDWTWMALFKGQWSSANLLPSEQVGIGGYYTVRGFAEREQNVDRAVLVSTEVRSPFFALFSDRGSKEWKKDQLQIIGFFDYGKGSRVKRIEEDPSFQALGGAGPGIRYRVGDWLDARADWGMQVRGKKGSGFKSRAHFGVTLSY